MLRVKCGSNVIEVRFCHPILGVVEIHEKTGFVVDSSRRCSIATVSFNGNRFDIGMAVCSTDDNFCKSFGRKKSLSYALNGMSRENRKAVWKEYEAMCGF